MKHFPTGLKHGIFIALIVVVALLFVFVSQGFAGDQAHIAASILHGEAPDNCEKCRELTAIALVRDMQKGVILRNRWYGWRTARDQDVALIRRAMEHTEQFKAYPECRFVGNGRDLEVWARNGWVSESVRVVAYCSNAGCSVCVPVIQPAVKAE